MKSVSWRERINNFFNICHNEVRKSTKIGQKMISASQINSSLKDSYEKLGKLVVEDLNKKNLNWVNHQATDLIAKINDYQKSMVDLEEEVNDIKFKEDKFNH